MSELAAAKGSSFADVDGAVSPSLLVDCLDGFASLPGVRAAKEASYAAAGVQLPGRVLDVGCGTGSDLATWSLAAGVPALGVDKSWHMLRQARLRAPTCQVIQADSHHLPFHDQTFAAVRCERLLMHDAGPHLAVAEMARVVRRGGRIVLVEPDMEGTILSGPGPGLMAEWLELRFTQSRCGRGLPAWLSGSGLTITAVEMHHQVCDYDTADAVLELSAYAAWAQQAGQAHDIKMWEQAMRGLDEAASFVCAIPIFVVTATRP